MDQIMNYVKPELLVLAVVLYFVGVGMKKTEAIADKYIPISLGEDWESCCAVFGWLPLAH